MRLERKTKKLVTASAGMILGMGALLPMRGIAQVPQSDDWQFGATIYGYLPTLSGSTKFPAGGGSDIEVSTDKLLSALKFVFMGALEAQKGPWGAFTDVMYLNLGGSKSSTRDLTVNGPPIAAGITANASLDIEGILWTVAGNYRAMSTQGGSVDLFAGTRLLGLKQNLRWDFSGPLGNLAQQGSSELKLNNWDGIVGFKGRINLGAKGVWFIPYYADVGTGASRYTSQGLAGLGYAFRWGELVAEWRILDYGFDSGSAIESLRLSGPAISAVFRW